VLTPNTTITVTSNRATLAGTNPCYLLELLLRLIVSSPSAIKINELLCLTYRRLAINQRTISLQSYYSLLICSNASSTSNSILLASHRLISRFNMYDLCNQLPNLFRPPPPQRVFLLNINQ